MTKLSKPVILFLCFYISCISVNAQTEFDTTITSKWYHSISIEGQLHNNYIYHDNNSNNLVLIQTSVRGFTSNKTKLKTLGRLGLTAHKGKYSCFLGFELDQPQHKIIYEDQHRTIHRYTIIGMPICGEGLIFNGYVKSSFYIGLVPGLVLKQSVIDYDSSNLNLPSSLVEISLNKLILTGELGFNFSLTLSKKVELFSNIMIRSILTPFYRAFPIGGYWVNYSSFNFGLGLKYNLV